MHTYTDRRIIAIHESAHLVTTIMGYGDFPKGSTPHVISIIPDEKRLGFVRDPAYANAHLPAGIIPEESRIAMVIRLLTGYAAEEILTGGDTMEEQWEFIYNEHDFIKALEIIKTMVVGRDQVDLRANLIMTSWFEQTVTFLQTPVVWQAIELVADELEKMGEINRDNGLYELIDRVESSPSFTDVRLITPTLDL